MAEKIPLSVKNKSAATNPAPSIKHTKEVAKLIDVSKCIGCKACQVACMEWNEMRDDVGSNIGVYDNPADLTEKSWTVMRFNEVVIDNKLQWLIRKDGCMHCEDPGCLKSCPSPGAIIQYANGIVDFQQDYCVGCGYCVTGCPFNIPRMSKTDNKAYKCTLCVDRVSVGLEPACIKTCPTQALTFGTKEEMIEYANTQLILLKERGFKDAILYDPKGVGGTHVMYILPYGNNPALYNNLPNDPQVSWLVSLWKGPLKTVASVGLIGAIIAGVLHFIRTGRKGEDEA